MQLAHTLHFTLIIDEFQEFLHICKVLTKKVKEFGQNASHELKTPLTIIKSLENQYTKVEICG